MPKNEDGEFELILGNKQLLSVFFIVVILLGVFFAMGFIVGRNSPAPVTDAGVVRTPPKPLVVEPSRPDPVVQTPPKETASQPEPVKPSEADTKAAENAKAAAAEKAAADAKAAKEEAAAKAKARIEEERRAKLEEDKEKARLKKEAKAEGREKTKKESAKADRARPAVGTPAGTFLQLAATTQHEAEAMVDLLRKKEFQSMAAEVPEKPGLYRVLVGPLSDGSVSKSRSELSAAGFPGDKAIKRSY